MPLSILHKLNKTVAQYREVGTSTATGFSKVYTLINSSLPCRRWMAGGREQETAARIEMAVTDIFMFGPNADVRRDDRIVDGDRTYHLLMVNEPSEPGVYQRAQAEEIQTGG